MRLKQVRRVSPEIMAMLILSSVRWLSSLSGALAMFLGLCMFIVYFGAFA
jgi:hypothetical protein